MCEIYEMDRIVVLIAIGLLAALAALTALTVRPQYYRETFLALAAELKRNDQFYLTDDNGEYISECQTGGLCPQQYPVRGKSAWIYIPYRDGTFSVKSAVSDRYWRRDSSGKIVCRKSTWPETDQPAKFGLIKFGDGTIGIKTDIGSFTNLTSDTTGKRFVTASIEPGKFRLGVISSTRNGNSLINHGTGPKNYGYAPIVIPFGSGSG
jgi:hypothetical protein